VNAQVKKRDLTVRVNLPQALDETSLPVQNFLTDGSGNYLTDASGNRLTQGTITGNPRMFGNIVVKKRDLTVRVKV